MKANPNRTRLPRPKITVAFTVCERPEYFSRVLDHWSRVRGVKNVRISFYVEPTAKTQEQVDLISEFHHPDKRVMFNQNRLGVLRNPHHALETEFRTGSDFAILAEEDLLVAEDTLEYFDWAAWQYLHGPNILGVMASSDSAVGDPANVSLVQRFSPWIWGTWRRRWRDVLGPTWDLDYSTGENGHQAGWDWNIDKRILPARSSYMVAPEVSRVQNIGKHGGAHAIPADFEATVLPRWRTQIPRQQYRINS